MPHFRSHSRGTLTAAALVLLLRAESPRAQTIASGDAETMRVSIRLASGGNPVDEEGSVDTAMLAGFMRIRAGVAHGNWPDPYSDRRQTRLRLMTAVLFFAPPLGRSDWRAYAGVGTAGTTRHGFPETIATPLLGGVEYKHGRWTVCAEIETTVSENLDRRRIAAADLWSFTPRVGIAIRRGL